MSSFKEIVTKAVIGKAKKSNSNTFTLVPSEVPNTVLGCWVINHSFTGSKGANNEVVINGSYDINVWYSYDSDRKTQVSTQNFSYTDNLNVTLQENTNIDSASEIIVRCLNQPTVSSVSIESGNIVLDVESVMGVEVVGDAKMKISVEDEEDDYEDISGIDDITNEINEDYLE